MEGLQIYYYLYRVLVQYPVVRFSIFAIFELFLGEYRLYYLTPDDNVLRDKSPVIDSNVQV